MWQNGYQYFVKDLLREKRELSQTNSERQPPDCIGTVYMRWVNPRRIGRAGKSEIPKFADAVQGAMQASILIQGKTAY
jgi:hypothetical protein